MIATVLRRLGAAGLAFGAMFAGSHVRAADVSAWDGDARSAVRLIAGAPLRDGGATLRAGVQIRLAPGWKTYWRYPGDSGVPPRFDFAQSRNLETVTPSWPLPHRFADGNGQSIGYYGDVLFPLQLVAKDPTQPIVVRLKLEYAVCEKLCVPAEGSAELLLSATAPGKSTQEAALTAAEARVPKPAAIGDGAAMGVAIRRVRQERGERVPRIIVDVAAPEGEAVDLFVEGPTPEWALPLPTPIAAETPGLRRFAFDLEGLPPGASAQGATLTLTAVAGGSAIEAKARLD